MAERTARPLLLLGAAATGKTQRLVELLVTPKGAIRPRWAVLPDRTQVSAFRRRIAAAGGALGVSVGTFGDLFQEILARAGRPVAVTPDPARQRLLRLTLRQLGADGRLSHYRPILHTPGFLGAVGEAIAELKRARVGPEAVAALAAETGRPGALREIALIFSEYERRLGAIPWTDREGLNGLALEALQQRSDLLSGMPLLAVDGFDSFEAAQLEALAALSRQVGQLMVTLPGSPTMERTAHRRFAGPLANLVAALPEAQVIHLTEPGAWPAPLRQLEAALFNSRSGTVDPEGTVEMIEARGPLEEAREALRWTKARLLRDGLALEECMLVVPDPGRYRPLLRRAAAEFGIRLRFAHGEPLVQSPPTSALLDLLELGRSNWPRRLVLQTVRSPFFDLRAWGLTRSDALLLDAASHAGLVVEGLDQWQEALSRLAEAAPDPIGDRRDEEPPGFRPPINQAAARLAEAVRGLGQRLAPGAQRSTSEWVQWLEDLLDELKFPDRVAAAPDHPEAEHPAFERLRETLRGLVLGEVVTGPHRMSFGEFLQDLRDAVEAATYFDRQGAGPAVDVLTPLEARGGRYAAVAILGLSEGLFPEVEREDPFLEESVRAALGLEQRLGREQAGLFYQAVTRPDSRLLLTRPYQADDGEAWEASPLWAAVARLLTTPPRRVRPGDPRPLAEAGSSHELLFWGVRRAGMPASLLEPHLSRWSELQHGRDVLLARSQSVPEGPHEGSLASLRAILADRFGPDYTWSPSRLESYATCPHLFFASVLLGLEPRDPPQPGLDPTQLGSILHEALEAAYRGAADPADVAAVLEALGQTLDPILDRAPSRYGFRPTPLWEMERAELGEALQASVQELAAQSVGWIPIDFEREFGIDDTPALELELEQQPIRIRGIIDRLDRRDDGGLRVVDYKTSASRLSPAELSEGRRLQLPLYALAVQRALHLGEVVDGFYWAIRPAKQGPLRLSNYRGPEDGDGVGPAAAYRTTLRHLDRIVHDLQAGDFKPVPPPGGCPGYCPAVRWCWRYRPERR